MNRLFLAVLGLLWTVPAFAICTNTVTVKDGAGVSQTFCRGTDGTNMISTVNILDSAGTNFASVTAANALKVDGSAATQPVSGTVTANQGGTWTVQPGNTANTTAWLVTGTGGTFPATQSGTWNVGLNAGSNTIGKVDILGNAGAVMDFAGQNAAQPANELLVGCAFNTTPTTVTSGNATQLQCDSTGNTLVKVNVALPTGSNTIGGVTQASGPWTSNVTQFGGTNISTGTGASGTGIPRVTISNDSSLAANQSVNVAQIAGTATSIAASGTQKVGIVGNAAAIMDFAGQNAAQPANSLLTGCEFNTSPTAITSGNASPLQCTTAARLIVDGSQVTQPVSGTVSINAIPTGSNTIGKVDILGNAGAALDATVAAGAAPTNGLAVLGQYNTTVPTPSAAQTVALQTNQNGYLLAEQGCAGQSVANTSVKPFSLASTTSLKIVALVSGKKVYICSIDIVSATAQNVALIEGTKTTNDCDTSTAGLAGGTTAATGWNFAANGGLTKGNGQGVVYKSGSASLDVCLLSSSTGQISGAITYAQF